MPLDSRRGKVLLWPSRLSRGSLRSGDLEGSGSVPLNSRPSELLNASCVYFPSLEFTIGISMLSSWFVIDFLTCRVRPIMVGKAEWKPLYLVLPRNRVNLK